MQVSAAAAAGCCHWYDDSETLGAPDRNEGGSKRFSVVRQGRHFVKDSHCSNV